jgi:uncharacterized protein
MIRFEGLESFTHTRGDLYAKLADAGWLANTLPDVDISHSEPDRAAWKVKPKFTFMSGTLDTTAEVLERVDGQRVRYSLTSKGVGSSSTLVAVLDFQNSDSGGTVVNWTGELTELGGLLKMVPRPLLQATARKVIEELWTAVHSKAS